MGSVPGSFHVSPSMALILTIILIRYSTRPPYLQVYILKGGAILAMCRRNDKRYKQLTRITNTKQSIQLKERKRVENFSYLVSKGK